MGLTNWFGKKKSAVRSFLSSFTNFNSVSPEKWNPRLRPPDIIVQEQHERVVSECRDVLHNDSYGAGIGATFIENVLTSRGISIQNASDDQEFAKAVDAAWRKYSESKDVSMSGTLDLVQMQKQALLSLLSDGEIFVRKHMTPDGFKVSLLDPARIPFTLLTRSKSGRRYRNGILVDDATGRVLGYRVDDQSLESYRLSETSNVTRGELISADEILHIALKKRVDAMRGVPLLQPVAGRIWKISEYESSVLDNAVSSVAKYGFLKWSADAVAAPDLDVNLKPSKDKSGSWFELPPGLDVDSYQSAFPDGELAPFVRAILLAVSRALGVSYPVISGDISAVNYAAIRGSSLAERQVWGNLALFLLDEMLLPIYAAFFMDLLGRGELMVGGRTLTLFDLPEILNVETASVIYPEIDPKAEHSVETGRIQHLLLSPSAAIRSRGQDPDLVWMQVAQDIKDMQEAGIPSEYIHNLFLKQTFAIESLEDAKILEGE